MKGKSIVQCDRCLKNTLTEAQAILTPEVKIVKRLYVHIVERKVGSARKVAHFESWPSMAR